MTGRRIVSIVTCFLGLGRCVSGWIGTNPREVVRSSIVSMRSSSSNDNGMGLNELQTLLREAVKEEDYGEAKRWSDELARRLGINDKKKMSWRGLGTAPWLEDRLDALDYKFPTTIQIHSLESVNALLSLLEENQRSEQQQLGVVISGSTGSGKTLAYLVPLLSTLSESLFTRQRIRVQSEESIDDVANDLMERVAVQKAPAITGHGPSSTKNSSSMGKSGTDVQHPLALIVIPTRELGVQIALQLYQLVGGGGSTKQTTGLQNMFKYKGPKGVKIGCILEEEEAQHGLKLQTDVAITTPEFLPKLLQDGDILTEQLRVIVYDEADLCLEETSNDVLKRLFCPSIDDEDEFLSEQQSRLTYLVGASVTKSLGELCVKDDVLPQGKSYIATATHFAPLLLEPTTVEGGSVATLQDLNKCLDLGLRHERVLIPDGSTGLFCLTQLLRTELREFENKKDTLKESQRPRVVVFFPDEVQAKQSIEKLRDALWGDHKLCVLLPNMGVNPLQMMQDFKNGKTSVLLATPHSVRGLDFPNVSHVYTLYSAADTPRDYLHLAGRVGRIGQSGSSLGTGGRVTSIIPNNDSSYPPMAQALNFNFVDIDVPPVIVDKEKSDVENIRRYLEDQFTLLEEATDMETISIKDGETESTVDDDDNIDEE